MDLKFTGEVLAVIDKAGTKKSDGTAFKAWAIAVKEVMGQYPQSLLVDYFGEQVTAPTIGDIITVNYNTRANEHDGKWYGQNNLWKWSLDVRGDGSGAAPQQAVVDPLAAAPITGTELAEGGSPLPF